MTKQRENETDLDRLVQDIQQEIVDQERATCSATVIEQVYNPKNIGCISDPDARGLVHGWCGDTMAIYLRLNGERIQEARFVTDGCGPTVACGNMITTMATGMSLEEAGEVQPKELIDALDGLPGEHTAERALQLACGAGRVVG